MAWNVANCLLVTTQGLVLLGTVFFGNCSLLNIGSNTCIKDILRYTGCLPVLVDPNIRKYAFLCKTLISHNSVLVNLFHLFGKSELNTLSDAYGIQAGYSFLTFRSVLRNRYLSFS